MTTDDWEVDFFLCRPGVLRPSPSELKDESRRRFPVRGARNLVGDVGGVWGLCLKASLRLRCLASQNVS